MNLIHLKFINEAHKIALKRFGTPATTSRGFNNDDFELIGNMIADILDSLLLNDDKREEICNFTKNKVIELCSKYPIYNEAY